MRFTLKRVSRINRELKDYIYQDKKDISQQFKFLEINSADQVDALSITQGWQEISSNVEISPDQHYWFQAEYRVPEEFSGQPLALIFGEDVVESELYINNKLVQGVDRNHRHIIFTQKAEKGAEFLFHLHSYTGAQVNKSHTGFQVDKAMLEAGIAVYNKEIKDLYYDLDVPLKTAELLDKEDKRRIDIAGYLNQAINILDLRQPFSPEFYNSITEAREFLQEEFYNKFCGDSDVTAHCIGHTHIDVAWLWILSQTREKVKRSFSTVLNLMEQYPEYMFMSSQPQLYKFLKEDKPQLYEKVKQRIKEGHWEAEGGMWLEADCNLSSGESLVRQLLFGTRFFQEEFDVKSKLLWLPDVFGYSAALPQILDQFDIDYFMTTKISWNEYNQMPYDTFNWEGIDGTEVLTHFITTSDYDSGDDFTTTYNGSINPSQIKGAWERYQQKDLNDDVLVAFGHGDGGGGPTKSMLENARRLKEGIPGCPEVKIGSSLDFFENLEQEVKDNRYLPKWVGELYLEYHRGTYTTMARNKRYNRKCEFLYQDTELFNVLKQELTDSGDYPQQEINQGWETILLNQFHDIIPGTSIKPVYEESKEQYEEIKEKGKQLLGSALDNLTTQISASKDSVVVFNQLGFSRDDLVELELPADYKDVQIVSPEGKPVSQQWSGENKLIFQAENVPALGYKTFRLKNKEDNSQNTDNPVNENQEETKNEDKIEISTEKISNKFFEISLDSKGHIDSIYDKKNDREVLKDGDRANVLLAFEDKPLNWDAWDINLFYQEKSWEIEQLEDIEVVEKGNLKSTLKLTRTFLDSTIEQYIQVYRDLPRIDIKNIIDWQEKQILLKAAFPVDVHSNKANYEIQYGNVERPTHWNTSWDKARFEVVGHKWADLSEDNYGVSLMNDCKYGYDIKDNIMRLTLIKSPVMPNEDADRERHEFTYSLYPHEGDWKKADTVNQAYQLNCPLYARVKEDDRGNLPEELSLAEVDQENVIIETVKQAEDDQSIIIRLYECYNRRTSVQLKLFAEPVKVQECDLKEEDIGVVEVQENEFNFEIKP
ncbi:MAG: alpha-mannosidase, partial [Halanaerobiaceae bacterium]